MPVIAAGAQVAGTLVGSFASQADRNRAQSAMEAAIAQIQSVGAPPDLSAAIIKEKFKQVGLLDPQLEEKIDAGVSEMANLQERTETRDAQMKALSQFGSLSKTGLSMEDRAAFNELRRKTQQDAEAKRQQVLQQMQARGLGGSGAELIAQLQAGQSGAEMQAQAGDNLSAQASQRALQALSQYGNLAGNVRTQDYDVDSAKAQAADELKRFDVSNQVARQQRNVSAKNQAQQYNLDTAQDVANKNTATANAEKERQAQAARQYWQDRLSYAGALAGGERDRADIYDKKAQRTQDLWSGIGSAGSKAFSPSPKTGSTDTKT